MADGLVDLAPQWVRDERTGAEVSNDGRDAIAYQLNGRTWRPYVERGAVPAVYVAQHPTWADGTDLTPSELAQAREVITRVFRHWGSDVEIVVPDPVIDP